MDDPQLTRFPAFEDLPFAARQRICTLAERFGIPPRKAMMLTMLLAQGVPMRDLTDACRAMGIPLNMSDIWEMRQEMSLWVSEDDHRRGIMQRLDRDGLLTDERRERLQSAQTKQEVMSIYFEAVPFAPIKGKHRSAPGMFDYFSDLNWLGILNAPVKRFPDA